MRLNNNQRKRVIDNYESVKYEYGRIKKTKLRAALENIDISNEGVRLLVKKYETFFSVKTIYSESRSRNNRMITDRGVVKIN